MDKGHSTDHPHRPMRDNRKRIREVQYVEFHHRVVVQLNGIACGRRHYHTPNLGVSHLP